MRVVIDTNVFISALLSPKGKPAKILERWREQVFDLIVSKAILTEYQKVLQYKHIKKYLSEKEIDDILKNLSIFAIEIKPERKINLIKDDLADNKFLECAFEGKARFIVSGDDHLLALKEYEEILIVTPAVFLSLVSTI
jgi:putative PIN family toxin of toxin-antitoxin system